MKNKKLKLEDIIVVNNEQSNIIYNKLDKKILDFEKNTNENNIKYNNLEKNTIDLSETINEINEKEYVDNIKYSNLEKNTVNLRETINKINILKQDDNIKYSNLEKNTVDLTDDIKKVNDLNNYYDKLKREIYDNKNNENKNLIRKTILIIIIILFVFMCMKLFIFNNKNKFLNYTTNIYNDILEKIETINKDLSFFNSNYINVSADINLTFNEANNNKIIKLDYIEDKDNTNIKYIENNDEKNINVDNYDIFRSDNFKMIKKTLDLSKKTVYKALNLKSFSKDEKNKIISLNLNGEELKNIIVRVLQKNKLNKNSKENLSRIFNLTEDEVIDKINDILNKVDDYKFKDLKIDYFYDEDKIKIIYDTYIIELKNNNLILSKNNNKLIDIIIDNEKIKSNNNSKYNISLTNSELDGKNIFNFIIQSDKILNISLLYNIEEKDKNKYYYDIVGSIKSDYDFIKSMGIDFKAEISNKK